VCFRFAGAERDRDPQATAGLAKVKDGIEFNDHIEGVAGHVVFDHACKLGHDGIVAKRKDLPSESGRSRRWIKIKNPDSLAMKRADQGGF
jgi:ATP-dependent DNA ligase